MSLPSGDTTIRDQIAVTMWVTAWTDYEENEGDGLAHAPGQDLMEVAPDTPLSAYKLADRFIAAFLKANLETSIEVSYRKFVDGLEDNLQLPQLTPKNFGHYLVMEAEGHGVGLWEWCNHSLCIPSLENLSLFRNEDDQLEFDYINFGE